NQPDLVFPFIDDFDDGQFDTGKWLVDSGSVSQITESGGTLTLASNGELQGEFAKIYGQTTFGMNTMLEVRIRHPQAGQDQKISEVGFMGAGFAGDKVRIADDFHNTTY